jgi:hypothetical protein
MEESRMALSIFDDKQNPPEKKDLEMALGRSYGLWSDLMAWLGETFDPVTEAWQFTGAKWGWNLKVVHKKRAIVYLTPRAKHFLAGFALGEKAVTAAQEAGLPEEIQKVVDDAPRYAEGRGVRLTVRNKMQNKAVKTLARAKMGT